MSLRRKNLNILLIILSLLLGGWAACLYRRPPLVFAPTPDMAQVETPVSDTILSDTESKSTISQATAAIREDSVNTPLRVAYDRERVSPIVKSTHFSDAEPRNMISNHPFRQEALKVLNGHLEETDSVSRHKILSYCEHLRTSYTTHDIDFIRQVFSDNALIIVGHVVRTGDTTSSSLSANVKVRYSVRSKRDYLERLARIFNSGKAIDVDFSDFRIMRHPTVKGIYGVTLRQKYSCGSYNDDGYLFLLWDFREMSMPQIHVRTWQPSQFLENGDEDIIDISDFNLK